MSSLVPGTLVKNVRINVETYIAGTQTLAMDAAKIGSVSIAAGATAQSIPDLDFAIAKLVFLYLLSDQDITLTFTCGSTTFVIALLANKAWEWDNTYPVSLPCPFPADVTTVTAANAGSVAATLTIRGGVVA